MMLELYIWGWMHLHPRHVLKQTTKFLGLSALILLPLLAMNVAMVKRGFVPDKPGLEINLSRSSEYSAQTLEE